MNYQDENQQDENIFQHISLSAELSPENTEESVPEPHRIARMSFTALALAALVLPNVFHGCNAFLDNNPDLGEYQNLGQCFPERTPIYLMYRNFEVDPYYGDKAKCVTVQETAPLVDSTTIMTVKYDKTKYPLNMTLASSPGYTVKNTARMNPVNKPREQFTMITAYADCASCFVLRHSYVDGGAGCSYWAPEKAAAQNNTCCQYAFDLLCGTSYKYQVYENCQ